MGWERGVKDPARTIGSGWVRSAALDRKLKTVAQAISQQPHRPLTSTKRKARPQLGALLQCMHELTCVACCFVQAS